MATHVEPTHTREPIDGGVMLPAFAAALIVGIVVIALMLAAPSTVMAVVALATLLALTGAVVALVSRVMGPEEH